MRRVVAKERIVQSDALKSLRFVVCTTDVGARAELQLCGGPSVVSLTPDDLIELARLLRKTQRLTYEAQQDFYRRPIEGGAL